MACKHCLAGAAQHTQAPLCSCTPYGWQVFVVKVHHLEPAASIRHGPVVAAISQDVLPRGMAGIQVAAGHDRGRSLLRFHPQDRTGHSGTQQTAALRLSCRCILPSAAGVLFPLQAKAYALVPAAVPLLSRGRCPSLRPSQWPSCCAAWAGTPRQPIQSASSLRGQGAVVGRSSMAVCQRGEGRGRAQLTHAPCDRRDQAAHCVLHKVARSACEARHVVGGLCAGVCCGRDSFLAVLVCGMLCGHSSRFRGFRAHVITHAIAFEMKKSRFQAVPLQLFLYTIISC